MNVQAIIDYYKNSPDGADVKFNDVIKYPKELEYGYLHNKSIIDIDCWIYLQYVLDEQFDYEQYLEFDHRLDEMVYEYDKDSEEIKQFKEELNEKYH